MKTLRMCRWLLACLTGVAAAPDLSAQSRQFGDVGVSVHRLANGATHHGYFEYRFTIANANPSRECRVTVAMPSDSRGRNRESLSRLRRTVKVSPGGTVSLPLFQPALPIDGNNAARIYVNGRDEGLVPLSGGLSHAVSHHGSTPPRPYLVSRSLDSSALDTALTKLAGGSTVSRVDYSPFQATGRPNVPSGRGGYHGNAWMPQRMGGFDWLELRYSKQVTPRLLRIYKTGREDSVKRVEFFGKGGAVIGVLTNVAASSRHESRYKPQDLKVNVVTQDVYRVRIEMDGSRGGYVGVDAVELIGEKGVSAFASGATASSTYATVHRSSSGRSVDKAVVLRSEVEVGEWSDSWLSYTPFDAVVLHETDLRMMPPAVVQAFWQYVEAGGVAAVLGRITFPKQLRARQVENRNAVTRYLVGFGECFEFDVRDTRNLDDAQLNALEAGARRAGAVWPAFGDVSMANGNFPVIENLSIPVRGIALIMLIFIIVVGPLNIIVLAKMNRRIWMLWTIPVISLATCAVVFVYSLFSEGITPTVRAESVTLLDHATRRATTLGRLAYYCPLTPSGGLVFDYDTEVYPLVARSFGGGTSKSLDWTDGQHLDSGWLQARMPAHFAVRRCETRRERLQFEKDADGNWLVVNGLGATIKQLVLRTDPDHEQDKRPREWHAGEIAPGARAKLTLVGPAAVNSNRHEILRKLFKDGRWSAEAARTVFRGGDYLDAAYVAEVAGTPFLEDGLAGRKRVNSESIVIGKLSRAEVAL